MGAVDPTYPLYPVASLLSAIMMLLVLLTSFIRQSWSLGVAFLCFWLFFENLTGAIGQIIWSDNADIKHYVYCDIVSHMQIIVSVVKPMSTLIITRRLYLIASLQAVSAPDEAARRRNLWIEWTLGLAIPVLCAGPLYYTVQGARFQVLEGFGCTNTPVFSVLEVLLTQSWSLIPPFLSIVIYYPKVAWSFYRQNKDINRFLRSDNSITRTKYFRILALASIDILLTLPMGVTLLVLNTKAEAAANQRNIFYLGWKDVHTNWWPFSVTRAELYAGGTADLAQFYFSYWSSPVLAFAIFALFGLTAEARASYRRSICAIGQRVGWKGPTLRERDARSTLGTIDFGARPQDSALDGAEIGSHSSFAGPSPALPAAVVTEKTSVEVEHETEC